MELHCREMFKAFATNLDATGFTAKTTMARSRPSGNGIIPVVSGSGGVSPARVRIFPYGLGAENDVFSLRVWGWTRIGGGSLGGPEWLPACLGEFSCTISAFVGLAGMPVLNTERFADTISIVATVGEATITAATTRFGTARLFSPANDTPAWVEILIRGCELLEFDGDQTTNTPTMNALVQYLDGVE